MNNDGAVYRGVVIVNGRVQNPPGNFVDVQTKIYLKPYAKAGFAKGSVTTFRKNNVGRFVTGWVEKSAGWDRLDD